MTWPRQTAALVMTGFRRVRPGYEFRQPATPRAWNMYLLPRGTPYRQAENRLAGRLRIRDPIREQFAASMFQPLPRIANLRPTPSLTSFPQMLLGGLCQ